MNILLMDDERYRLESLQRGLKIIGYKVFATSNVEEAIARLGSCQIPIDVIITDYATSFAGSSEMIQTIESRHGKIPVVMMTGSRKAGHESHPLWPWCEGLIEKPFELDELAWLIESVGKGGPAADADQPSLRGDDRRLS